MSPSPPNEPAKRRRTRRAEPDGQGTWLDLGEGPPPAAERARRRRAGRRSEAAPEEPEWLRDVPVEPDLAGSGPALDPEAVAAAIEARRAARAEEIVSRLNPEQARAVTTTDGPLLILAGAGSGKTRVIAHRIAYLIGVKAVQPRRILAVTFTNRAAGELRERITALVGEHGKDVQAGTFHALCARVLRQDGEAIGLDRRFVIYDTDDQQQLMKRILAEEDLPATGEFRPAAILGAISRAKNEMLDETFLAENAVNHRERIIARLAARYRDRLRAANALDFDDLLLRAVDLFEQSPEALAKYHARWLYLHVDEYQDTNRPQYLWIRALASAHRNLCVVGDDDQSIYGWRGANVQNILDFERDYPEATVVKLEQNYRSTQLILDAAHAVVSRNERRTDKKLWTENQGGVPIQRFEAFNEEEEAEWIARQIEGLVGSTGRGSWLTRRADDDDESSRFRAKDVAVMYRMNAAVPGHRGEVPRLRDPLPDRRRHAVLPAARGQGRAGLPAGPPLRHGPRLVRADHQRAGPGHRRQERRGAAPVRGRARRQHVGGDRGRGRRARSRAWRRGSGTPSRTSPRSCAGSGRASACCRCPSCSTRSSRRRATGRCSPTGPRRARTAGRTCSSCAR